MQLIDEVIGYAKANADAARTEDEKMTWAAHHRNCVQVKAEIERLRVTLEKIGSVDDAVSGDGAHWRHTHNEMGQIAREAINQ